MEGHDAVPAAQPRFAGRSKSQDVVTNTEFSKLGLDEGILVALAQAGFVEPSPVQAEAVPIGTQGKDLLVQAKSGTGKTVAFVSICLQRTLPLLYDAADSLASGLPTHTTATGARPPRVLVLAPTREIAVQIHGVFTNVTKQIPEKVKIEAGGELLSECFIGGLPVPRDIEALERGPIICVGTPGRMRALLQNGLIEPSAVAIFIIDEADRLLEDGEFEEDLMAIHFELPHRKQVIAVSATMTPVILNQLGALMRDPVIVNLCEETTALEHVHVYTYDIQSGEENEKIDAIIDIVERTAFNQAVVFWNVKSASGQLTKRLVHDGYPCVQLSGGMEQTRRLAAVQRMRSFRARILVTSDLAARGVDLEHVSLVISVDIPREDGDIGAGAASTLCHRLGRTGRFGTVGIAVLVCSASEKEKLLQMLKNSYGNKIEPLPDEIMTAQVEYEMDDAAQEAMKTLQEAPKMIRPHVDSSSKGAGQDEETKAIRRNNRRLKTASANPEPTNACIIEGAFETPMECNGKPKPESSKKNKDQYLPGNTKHWSEMQQIQAERLPTNSRIWQLCCEAYEIGFSDGQASV